MTEIEPSPPIPALADADKPEAPWGVLAWLERIAKIVAIPGFVLSLVAIVVPYLSASYGRGQSATSLLIQSRLTSMKQFSLAYGELDSALTEGAASTSDVHVIDLEEPSQIMDMTLDDARRLAPAVRRVSNAFRMFDAEVNGSRGMWSDPLEEHISASFDYGSKAADCFLVASSPPMNDAELPAKRKYLLDACADLRTKVGRFREASGIVVTGMVIETRVSFVNAGVDRSDGASALENAGLASPIGNFTD